MALPEGMQTLASRLASFESTKQKGKKRTSTKSKKTTSNWPLEAPTPEDLAQAGFFLSSTSTSPDNVTCFSCHKSLDEWEEGDDPFREHLQFAPECAWAVTMAVERSIILKDDDHDPLAEDFIEMRTATFGNAWPHESKKGWTPKVKKLVDAGWHYNPTPDEEDQTKCAYCSLCVSGWEPKDKPLEEHKRRAPECPFFHLTQLHKKTRPKKGRAFKASRVSNISIATWTKEPSMLIDESTNLDDSIMSTATDVTTASTATTATRKSTRAKKSTAKAAKSKQKQEEVVEQMDIEEPEEDKEVAISSPTVAKPKRGRKRSSVAMLDSEEDEVIPPPKKRGTRGRSSTARPEPPPAVESKVEPSPEPMPASEERSEPEAEPEAKPEPELELELETQIDTSALPLQQDAEPDSKMEDIPVEEAELETLAMPKRGAKGKNARGSAASRKASGAKGRKATGPRKASGRKASNASIVKAEEPSQPMELDDAAIEEQLAADLDRPLSDEETTDPVAEEQPKPQKPGRGRQSAAKKSASRPASDTVSQPSAEPKKLPVMADDSEEDELADTYQAKPVSRAEKLFSNPYADQPDDVQLSGDESSHSIVKAKAKKPTKKASTASASAPAPKAKRGRPPKKAAQKAEEAPAKSDPYSGSEPRTESVRDEPTELRFSSSFEDVPSILDDVEVSVQVDEAPVAKAKAPATKNAAKTAKVIKATKPARAPAATKKGKGKKASAVLTGPEEPAAPPKVEAAAREPTPDAQPAQRQATPEQEVVALSPPQSAPGAFPSPTPSPQQSSQGSNAENEPPSSRPSHTRPPLGSLTPNKSAQRVPLGSAGPSTPVHSTPRIYEDADATGTTTPQWALQSGFPWRPVDIENVFLPSPDGREKRWFGPKSADDSEKENNAAGRENSTPLSASKDLKDSRKKKAAALSAAERARQEKVRQMASVLTEADKDLTVEEWIRSNAERGEHKLRDQCERVVSRFESEGIRAMKALEGLVVEEWA